MCCIRCNRWPLSGLLPGLNVGSEVTRELADCLGVATVESDECREKITPESCPLLGAPFEVSRETSSEREPISDACDCVSGDTGQTLRVILRVEGAP